jgi:hypothetical protein
VDQVRIIACAMAADYDQLQELAEGLINQLGLIRYLSEKWEKESQP